MADVLLARAPKTSCPITLLAKAELQLFLKRQPTRTRNWVKAQGFLAKPGSFCILADTAGRPAQVLAGISSPLSLWDIADLPNKLPLGNYRLNWRGPLAFHEWLALGWSLGAYQYTRYKKSGRAPAKLVVTPRSDLTKIRRYADAIYEARDLINTPAEDMGPEQLAHAVIAAGKKYGAKVTQIVGQDLLKKNYPAVHVVGRASSRAPRLIDLSWGNPKHTRITLVGKGVCFDTGGLDLKPSSNMYLMKKDMGGAACALAVAQMVMNAKLPVCLRLLIPAVENSVSGNAFRPTDIITMRSSTTVEVGNTDAEGRLILADALTEAAKDKPALIVDFSTLTGAARTALGTEISALFCNDDAVANDLLKAGQEMEDPIWRLPLHAGYAKMIESNIAELNSSPNSPYAGAIVAALFLQQFVPQNQSWVHLDFMGWNLSQKPGRPEGGEAMAVRAVYRLIEQKIKSR